MAFKKEVPIEYWKAQCLRDRVTTYRVRNRKSWLFIQEFWNGKEGELREILKRIAAYRGDLRLGNLNISEDREQTLAREGMKKRVKSAENCWCQMPEEVEGSSPHSSGRGMWKSEGQFLPLMQESKGE